VDWTTPGAAARLADMFARTAQQAAGRYRSEGMLAWQFARGKLRGDPVYRAVLAGPWLRRGGTLIDVGCGQGLMLALIAEARADDPQARWPDRLVGIELRKNVAALGRRALAGVAEIGAADARTEPLPAARTVLLFDVLHMMPAADQEALLRGLVAALEPGGALLLREADAGAGWRFQAVKIANRTKAFFFGYSSRGFCFRTAAAWSARLEAHGLAVELMPMGQGTPYGNVLLAGTKRG
jgi:SAM-dependent methyltransferase